MDFTEPVSSYKSPLKCGALLDGKYEILKLLGTGGFGSVYQAHHIGTDKIVALKVLHPNLAIDSDALNRFQREARIISTLRHDNILEVYAFGSTSDGIFYMSTEFVDGRSLAEILAEHGPFNSKDALPILEQICKGMQYAHDNNVLHRDLKPANVIIVTDKTTGAMTAKIVDFGLARLTGDRAGQVLTQTGEVIGDPNYMSPEQCQGRPLDARSDIYSFGCLMYAVFTGRPPFLSDTPVASLFKQISEQPKPFAAERGLPRSVESITLTALAKEPQKRYESFNLLRETLQDFVTDPHLDVAAPHTLPGSAGAINWARQNALVTAALAGALVLIAGAAWFYLRPPAAPKQSPAVESDTQIVEERLRDLDVQWHKRRQLPPLAEVRKLVAIAQAGSDRSTLARAKTMLAWVLSFEGQNEESLKVAREALEMPEFPESERDVVMNQAARTAFQLQQYSEAEKIAEEMVNIIRKRKNPNKSLRIDEYMQLIHIKVQMHKINEAESLCRELCAEYPRHPDGTHNFEVLARSGLGKQVAEYKLSAGLYKDADEIIAAMDQTQLTFEGRPAVAFTIGLSSLTTQKRKSEIDAFLRRALSVAKSPYEKVVYLEFVIKHLIDTGMMDKAKIYLKEMEKLAATTNSTGATEIGSGTETAKDWVSVAKMYLERAQGHFQAAIEIGEPVLPRLLSGPDNRYIIEECNWVLSQSLENTGQPEKAAAVKAQVERYFSGERLVGR